MVCQVGNMSASENGGKMRCWPNVGLLLDHRRRRWANSKPALGQRWVMFAGLLTRTTLKYLCTDVRPL